MENPGSVRRNVQSGGGGGQGRTLPRTDARSSRLCTWGARGHLRGLMPHNRDPGGLGA